MVFSLKENLTIAIEIKNNEKEGKSLKMYSNV